MLILSRKLNEGIIIGDIIHLKVIRIDGDTIKIGIEAPKGIPIFRTEIYQSAHSGSLKSRGIKSDRTEPVPKPVEQERATTTVAPPLPAEFSSTSNVAPANVDVAKQEKQSPAT